MAGSKKPAGLSLAETIVGLALVALVLSLGILQFRTPVSAAGSKGVAQVLAAQLIAARQRALSQHTSVAVVIPSAGGTRPYAQSLAIMEGEATPRVRQVLNLAREFPRSYVALGTWDRSLPSTLDAPAQQNSFGSRFDVGTWLAGAGAGYQARDFVVVFTPDGKVNSNDLPWVDGRLLLVAASGLDFRAAAPPPGLARAGAHAAPLFELFQVYQAHTVSVTQEGVVSVSPGLLGANPAAISQTPVVAAVPPAAAPLLGGATNQDPVLVGLEAYPQAEALIPGGHSSVLASDGFVTLVLRVTDPDPGERLCCRFTATAMGGGEPGTFTHGTNYVRMTWDPDDRGAGHPNGCWKTTCVWTPPGRPDDARYSLPDGSVFEIQGEVLDAHGGSLALGGGANVVRFQIVARANVVCSAVYQGRRQLFWMSPGTRTASVLPIETDSRNDLHTPAVSPDGKQILYVNGTRDVYVCDLSGRNNRLLYSSPTPVLGLSWSPDGTRYVLHDANNQLVTLPVLAGAAPTSLTSGSDPCWADVPGQREWIAYVNPAGDVTLIHPTNGSLVPVTTDSGVPRYALCSWSQGSDLLFFQSADGQILQIPITWDGSGVPSKGAPNPVAVANPPGFLLSPLRFWGQPTQAVSALATGFNLADYVDGATPTFVQNLHFQIETPPYTSGWDDINWIR